MRRCVWFGDRLVYPCCAGHLGCAGAAGEAPLVRGAVRFHDLRHGSAGLSKAARQDTKIISDLLGHHRTSFTDDVYVNVFPDVAREAAEERVAIMPRQRLSPGSQRWRAAALVRSGPAAQAMVPVLVPRAAPTRLAIPPRIPPAARAPPQVHVRRVAAGSGWPRKAPASQNMTVILPT